MNDAHIRGLHTLPHHLATFGRGSLARAAPLRRSTSVALLCGMLAVVAAARTGGAACVAPPGAPQALANVDGRERLFWINRHLELVARRGRVWALGWGVGIGAAGAASLMAVPFVAPSNRVDWYTGAATAAVGVVPFIVSPLTVTRDGPRLGELIATTPLADDDQTCALLAKAELMLRDDAANERRNRAWYIHVGNLAFNTGVFLFLGIGFHHWTAGAVNGLAGAAVGEAIIFTQPTGAIHAAEAYDRGDLSAAAPTDEPRAWGWAYATTF